MKAPAASAPAALAWSGDGHWLAVHDRPEAIRLLRRGADGAQEQSVALVDFAVDAVALNHDARWLAAGGSGQLVLWSIEPLHGRLQVDEVSRGRLPPSADDSGRVELAFAPDGRSLAVATGAELLLLLRLDCEALRPKLRVSSLRIRPEGRGERWAFVLQTPAGEQTLDKDIRPGLDADTVISLLRPSLVVIDPETPDPAATPAERLDEALAPLRRRLVPPGLGEPQAMGGTADALALDPSPELSAYPWELLLTGRGSAPLGITHGLVRLPAGALADRRPADGAAPLHVLLLSAIGAPVDASSSVADLDHRQAARLAEAWRDAGPAQGLIEHRSHIDARQAMSALLDRDWRVVVAVGTPDGEGALDLGAGVALGHRELAAMRRTPDLVLLLGGDFRRLAARLREAGVAVCVASGWPMETDSLWCFFSEWLRVLRSGEPLVRAVQMARQFAHTRSSGTAWALEVHGDPSWTWPEVSLRSTDGPAAADAPAPQGTPLALEVLDIARPGDAIQIDFEDGEQLVLDPRTVKDAADDPAAVPAGFWQAAGLSVLAGLGGGKAEGELRRRALELDAHNPVRLFAPFVDRLPRLPEGAEVLVLLHGLMGDYASSFGALGRGGLQRLSKRFGAHVLSFEHHALTEHPLDTAWTLIDSLPAGVRLHLLTHGSGCLVAEAIAWALATADQRGGVALTGLLGERRVSLERVVRVAGPVRGFGSPPRIDLSLSMQLQLLDRQAGKASEKLRSQRSAFLLAVARNREATARLAGLETMSAQSAFIRDLNGCVHPAPGQLRVVSASCQGAGSTFGRLSALLGDALMGGESDLLVPTRSTFGGVPRAGGALFFLHRGPEVSHYDLFGHALTRRAILDALLHDEPAGFAPIGPLSAAGQSPDGLR